LVSLVVKVTLAPWQILLVDGEMVTVGTTTGFTVIFACVLVDVVGEAQVASLVITTQTESLLFKVVLEYELVVVFCFETPSTKKLYMGVAPPLVSLVVKVTFVPWQMVVAEGEIVTVGTTTGFTVISTWVLVAVVGDAQVASLVITTQMESLLFNVVLEYVLVAPLCLETPSTKKLYVGVAPPLVSLVVKFTFVPWHMVVAEGEIVTVGTTTGFTVIFACALVAVVGEAQLALLVITTQTESLLLNVVLE